jgi:SAM-dependent methyltransferase
MPETRTRAIEAQLESVDCDLCGSKRASSRLLWRGGAWPAPVPEAIALIRCGQCGLVYQSPRPTPASIGVFYPPDYAPFRPAVEDEPLALMRWMRRRKLQKRRQLVETYAEGSGGRVLDVGCSTGLFLNEMRQGGWEAQGVELTPSAAAYARERFDLEVFEGMLEDAPFEAGSFDAITFWDVLEHVFSPRKTLARSHALLAPGGTLAINIPNWKAMERGLFGRYWAGYDPPRHLYVFPHETLERYLREAGFEPLAWTCFMPSYFTLIISVENLLAARAPALAGPVLSLLRLPGLRFLLQAPFWLMDRMGRGSVISVFARKIG